ncbi:ATP-binding protein [Candidatus Viridilinea mediisalina]|uniref:Orc1-like AAA ATPase domain-containing protein n=1 Tax=Candidatus Viridilinea mediisalina TaxID=2024553 RepID=A0A2A6RHF4_9CHLR|nr:ATP-binding protein [Candidatus Viridilinea mediisalina]PDW02315.1 hypothetical protein CJ255_14610 [Candidatus Viridilinea mediisalina]
MPSTLFVNREQDIATLDGLLNIIDRPSIDRPTDGNYLDKCVVNVYGAPGIGKSALLHKLRHNWQAETRSIFFIDLHEKGFQAETTQQKVRFCQQILTQFPDADEPRVTALQQQLIQIDTQHDERLDTLGEELVALMKQRKEQRIILLLIDACEQASDAFFAWLERRIILPIIHDPQKQQTRALCLMSSQLLLRWRQHNVRRRVTVLSLAPLSAEATTKLIDYTLNGQPADGSDAPFNPEPAISALGQQLYSLTFGHPLATHAALEHLDLQKQPEELNQWIEQHRLGVSREIVQRLRKHATRSLPAFQAQPRSAPQTAAWEGWQILEALSILREFEVNSMRVVLSAYNDTYRDTSQSMLLIYIRELLETRFAIWNSELRAYQVAASIRRIIAHHLAIHNEQLYVNLRTQAKLYYQQQIKTVMNNRHVYLLEYFFQSLSQPETVAISLEDVQQDLAYFLQRYYALRDDTLQQLLRAFAADHELSEIVAQRRWDPALFTKAVQEFQDAA